MGGSNGIQAAQTDTFPRTPAWLDFCGSCSQYLYHSEHCTGLVQEGKICCCVQWGANWGQLIPHWLNKSGRALLDVCQLIKHTFILGFRRARNTSCNLPREHWCCLENKWCMLVGRARGRGQGMGQGAKVGAALLCFPVVDHNCFIFYSRGNLDSYSKMLGGLWWLSFQENWQCPHQATLLLLSLGPLQSESTAQANATKFSLKAAARISMQLKARNTHSSWKSRNNYYH